MADKEVTIYLVDLGKSMKERKHGRDVSDLEWCMQYVWDKITTGVSTGRKTLCAGCVGYRTDETNHLMGDDPAYKNINTLLDIKQVLMSDIRNLREKVQPSTTNQGDLFSALVVAIQMITTHCKKNKWVKKIVLVTNGEGFWDTDGIGPIAKKLKEENIQLTILGADFDDADYGVKEEGKSSHKESNERILKDFVEQCDGVIGTMEQAVSELGIPRLKSTRPVPVYKGPLILGDPANYDTAMSIEVERFPRVMVARPPTASNFVLKAGSGLNGDGLQEMDVDGADQKADLAQVYNNTKYQVREDDGSGEKKEVDRDDLSKGYTYGRTAVHIDEAEATLTKLETMAGLEILGFVMRERYEHYLSLSRSNMVVAQRTNDAASMALSAFIHALYELDLCAVARLVTKDGKDPSLILMAPSVEAHLECLIDVELPFAEDVRQHKFPPLDRIITVSGKTLKEHRNLPKPELLDAMAKFVDHMDVSSFGKDDEGNPMEYLPFDETYSPVLHRIQAAIRYRSVHPEKAIPEPPEILTKFQHPPKELLDQAAVSIDRLKIAAEVKKVPPKALSKRGRYGNRKAPEQPRSGLDVDALLSSRRASDNTTPKISKENAIPEFKQMLADPDSVDTVKDAVNQLSKIVEEGIRNSLGDQYYEQALEALSVMRQECFELEEPGVFNDAMKSLKHKLINGSLNGDRREMWYKIRVNRVGLIDKKASQTSEITEEEAKEFMSAT